MIDNQRGDGQCDPVGDASARRVPLGVRAWVDLPIRIGSFRLSLGPTLDVWQLGSSGLGDPRDTVTLQPGVTLGIAYRYTIGRVVLSVGLAAHTAFSREDLVISGLGVIGHLPIVDLAPELGLTVRL